jgi:predicted Zn finger-like uncharacterized protein
MSIVLSCPSCSTRYRANPSAIDGVGRRVRCASCSHTWTAELDDPADLPALEAVDGGGSVDEEVAPVEEDVKPHEAFREREAAKRRTMSAAVAGGAWGGLATVCALLLMTAWVFRVDVVTLWPRAASAYAAMGAEVNPFGFSVGELTITRESEHGVPLVVIEGSIKNFDRRARALPTVRALLKDDHGESLLEWTIPLEGGRLSAGEVREFRSIVSDPPPQSVEAEVVLVAATRLAEHGRDHEHETATEHDETVATDDAGSHDVPAADNPHEPVVDPEHR